MLFWSRNAIEWIYPDTLRTNMRRILSLTIRCAWVSIYTYCHMDGWIDHTGVYDEYMVATSCAEQVTKVADHMRAYGL